VILSRILYLLASHRPARPSGRISSRTMKMNMAKSYPLESGNGVLDMLLVAVAGWNKNLSTPTTFFLCGFHSKLNLWKTIIHCFSCVFSSFLSSIFSHYFPIPVQLMSQRSQLLSQRSQQSQLLSRQSSTLPKFFFYGCISFLFDRSQHR